MTKETGNDVTEQAVSKPALKTDDGNEIIQEGATTPADEIEIDEWEGGADFTEAELMGEDLEEESEAKEAEPASPEDIPEEIKPEEDEPVETEGEESEEAVGETAEEKKPVETNEKKPPVGFVPLEALHAERERRKQAAEMAAHWKEVAKEREEERAAGTSVPVAKVAIPEELKEDVAEFSRAYPEHIDLLLENSKDGARLRARLGDMGVDSAFESAENIVLRRRLDETKLSHEQLEAKRTQEVESAYVLRCEQEMAAAVPGIYDQSAPTAKELTEFAIEHGFNEDYLGLLTNPRTVIIPPGQASGAEKKFLLGDGAVGVVKAIHALKQKTVGNTPDMASLKKKVEAELRPQITKELLEKLQKSPGYRGLDDVPSAGGDPPRSKVEVLSPEEFDRLSPKAKEEYLGG